MRSLRDVPVVDRIAQECVSYCRVENFSKKFEEALKKRLALPLSLMLIPYVSASYMAAMAFAAAAISSRSALGSNT